MGKRTAEAEPNSKWPAANIEWRDTHGLLAYQRNSRIHSDAQVDAIVASMKEFGWTTPMLVDEEGIIIAGHGRAMAAAKLGVASVPVMVAKGWTEAQKMAYRIWDNQSALLASWDTDMLKLELTELGKMDFDLSLTGFDELELVQFMATPNVNDPEETPEPPANPVSKKGDLWLLGNHRLLCGDSTNETAVGLALYNARPNLMVSDPPYGVEYDPNWRNERPRSLSDGRMIGGSALGVVTSDERADWREAWELFSGDVAYVWHGGLHAGIVQESLASVDMVVRSQIIWAKNNMVIGRGDFHWKHEACWYAVRKGKTGHWQGDRTQTTVWEIDKPMKSETGHSTQKPIECMQRPMQNNSKPGDWVYDPFCGSGTSIIAAEMIQRKCIGIEIDPAYVDVSVQRWQTYTGQEAALEATGETYTEVANKRLNPPQKPAGRSRKEKAQ